MLQRQQDTIEQILKRRVRWIVIDTHNHPETGFGKSYGQLFYLWIQDTYELTASHSVEGGGGVYVYRRRI